MHSTNKSFFVIIDGKNGVSDLCDFNIVLTIGIVVERINAEILLVKIHISVTSDLWERLCA